MSLIAIASQGGKIAIAIGNVHKKYLFSLYDEFKEWYISPPILVIRKSHFDNTVAATTKEYTSWVF